MKKIKGYKALNKDCTNNYGLSFEEGMVYTLHGNISFGINGNGYHMCKHLCDVFRYVDAIDDEVVVAAVVGSGKIVEYDDEYYGYYDMYACQTIKIERFLTREEIIQDILKSSENEVLKFLMTFRLNKKEIEMFVNSFKSNINICSSLLYYQLNYKDIYLQSYQERNDVIRKVLKYGQNSDKGC